MRAGKTWIEIGTATVGALLLVGCGAKHTAWDAPPPGGGGAAGAPTDAVAGLVAAGDAAWAERGDFAKVEIAIAKWEEAINAGADWKVYEKVSRAHYLRSDGHLRFERPEKDAEFLAGFESGFTFAAKGLLAMSPAFADKVLKEKKKPEDNLDLIPNEGIGLMYWYATNLGKWAVTKGFATILARKDEAKKYNNRVLNIDEKWFHGAAHRYFGAFYAKAPAFAGGDMEKSKEHFDKAIEIAPHYHGTYVLIAEYYMVKQDDREGFLKYLNHALETPDSAVPGMVPEALVEKRKAKKLIDEVEDKF